ncbi:MAG: alpha/beta fold hydrolase, partial [Acetobacteraceae bacterium]
MTRITRHFVSVGERRVHYTRAGDGPPVLMLHASPCSAKVLKLPQTVFAARFTAFAFDTPGFGLSDPLPATPEIRNFADALAATMDALGLAEAAAYGRHTGAGIAVEFARRHPGRCSMALADGYPVFPAPYSEERLARYLEPIVPRWDGGHLLWLWFRYREQHVFWPWDAHDDAHRSDTDVPDVEFLHRGVVELMEAGDGYRAGYASAFRHEGLALLPELRRPVCFGARPGDSMMGTLALYPAGAWVAEMPREPFAAAVAEREVLERHKAGGVVPEAPGCAPVAGRTTTDYVDLGDSQMLLRAFGDAEGPPLLLLHAVPGSSALHDGLIRALGRHRRVLAFDLPGQGESEPADGWFLGVGEWAGRVREALDRVGVGVVHVFGVESGATVAVEL